jgi:hypothetical protein
MSNSDLERAAELAAQMSRTTGQTRIESPPPVTGGSLLDAAANEALATIKDMVTKAEAADIAAADQQQAILADLARRERKGRL